MASERIHDLPSPATPFFGRRHELAELTERLRDPACQLITLTGPGGIGKTRLALRLAADIRASFPHDVRFVALQPVSSAAFLPIAVATTLGVPLTGASDALFQLCAFLSDKALLLILDNFEHLLRDGGVELLPQLLDAAPALKLLVTSRAALQLQCEWRYPVRGMPVPSSGQPAELARYDLVQLFVERARRVRSDFSLSAEEAGVARVCQLVEGAPLAVELAASWTDVLPCDLIAAELEHDLQLLRTPMRDVPERHRSMRTVFDHSWKLLSPEERDVFQRLAVFRGGFRREATEQIAGATLPILAALVRQSLLERTPDGRYQIHELVRQYAGMQLAQAAPDAAPHTRDRHCAYYTTFLRERNAALNGGAQIQAVTEIAAELDNVRAAWDWAVERGNIEALVRGANALFLFCQYRSHYLDGIQFFERAAQRLDDTAWAAHCGVSLLLYQLGWLYVRLGRLDTAEATFARCLAVYQPHCPTNRAAHAADPRLGLGLILSLRGDYAGAQGQLEEARRLSEQDGHLGNQQTADYFLAGVHLAQGRYQAAHAHAQAAHDVAAASHDRWFMAFCLNELGQVARAVGANEEAMRHFQASYALREAFGDAGGMAVALLHLGAAALMQGNLETTEASYRQSLAIYRDINDHGGRVAALDGLGQVCAARGQTQVAARHFLTALEIAAAPHFLALRLSLFVSAGQLLLPTGYQERAIAALRCAGRHPATADTTRERARQLLTSHSGLLERAPLEQDRADDLERLTTQIQTALAELAAPRDASASERRGRRKAAPASIDALTVREHELLALLAAGHSYQEIAAQLTIAVGSVKSHAHNIYTKLGVRNRVQAAARAAELGLL